MEIWNALTGLLHDGLGGLHSLLEPLFGANAWGWAIVGLTIVIRILLLPLAVKQTRSMRAMQTLQPEMKAIQKKYKVNRDLLRTDPQKYRERRQKMNEEVMALYKERGVNPASGCLPLLPQIPVFFALFSVLRSADAELRNEPFYFFTRFVTPAPAPDPLPDDWFAPAEGLGALVNQAGWPGWVLILLMAGTMFFSTRQLMARNTGGDALQTQQQKIMLYVMPVFLAVISQGLPIGVLLYWVTTNFWQVGQQWWILRDTRAAAAPDGNGRAAAPPGKAGRQGDSSSAKGRNSSSAKGRGASSSAKGRGASSSAKAAKDGSQPKRHDGAKKKAGAPQANKKQPKPSAQRDSKPPPKQAPKGGAKGGGPKPGAKPEATARDKGKPARRDHLPRRPGS